MIAISRRMAFRRAMSALRDEVYVPFLCLCCASCCCDRLFPRPHLFDTLVAVEDVHSRAVSVSTATAMVM